MDKAKDVLLSWARQDIEQRLFFRGGKHTRVNTLSTAILAMLLSILFYCALMPFTGRGGDSRIESFAGMFTELGVIPYVIVFFSSWSFSILALKSWKIAFQRRVLSFRIIPEDIDFVLSAANVDVVIDRMYELVDDPKYFVLFNRIAVALANLRNLGRVSDVDEILRSQADGDEASMETSYSLLSGFVWAIPVMGFIGTVLGLSDAISGFGEVLRRTEDVQEIKGALQGVTGGLSLAFVTTLQALVAALAIQLWLTFVKKSEQEFLDECAQYCTNNIVNRLRIMPFERAQANQ